MVASLRALDFLILESQPINAKKVHFYLYLMHSFRKQILQAANTDFLTH